MKQPPAFRGHRCLASQLEPKSIWTTVILTKCTEESEEEWKISAGKGRRCIHGVLDEVQQDATIDMKYVDHESYSTSVCTTGSGKQLEINKGLSLAPLQKTP